MVNGIRHSRKPSSRMILGFSTVILEWNRKFNYFVKTKKNWIRSTWNDLDIAFHIGKSVENGLTLNEKLHSSLEKVNKKSTKMEYRTKCIRNINIEKQMLSMLHVNRTMNSGCINTEKPSIFLRFKNVS